MLTGLTYVVGCTSVLSAMKSFLFAVWQYKDLLVNEAFLMTIILIRLPSLDE